MPPVQSRRLPLGYALLLLLLMLAARPVAAQATVYVVNSSADTPDGDVSDKVCKTAAGTCTLRAALEQANVFADEPITIQFGFTTPTTLAPQSAYPPITRPLVIDGTGPDAKCPDEAQPATLLVTLSGVNAGAGASGLTLAAGSSGSTLRGLAITNFAIAGIDVQSDGNVITCNHIGINRSGNAAGNAIAGVRISGSSNRIGGTMPADRNVISGNAVSGNTSGIYFSAGTANSVQGNYIGSDAGARSAVANSIGILADAGSATIGGALNARNLISGNSADGIRSRATLTVAYNHIGTNLAGSSALANGGDGISNGRAFSNIGVLTAHNNVISGNGGYGVSAYAPVTLYANIIGMQANGTGALGNGSYGVFVGPHIDYGGDFEPDSVVATPFTIGGATSAARNIIAGNSGWQVYINAQSLTGEFNQHLFGGTVGLVRHNYIGLGATGGGDGAVDAGGIHIPFASDIDVLDNAIMGGFNAPAIEATCTGSRYCSPAGNPTQPPIAHANILIADNTIGTNLAGTTALNAGAPAVRLSQAGGLTLRDNVIGAGAADYDVLVTSGLSWGGTPAGSQGNTISGNIIGLAADASRDLNSGVVGVSVSALSFNNTLAGNAISADGGAIIELFGDDNTVSGNWLGIDSGLTLAVGDDVGLHITGDDNTVFDNVIAYNATGILLEGARGNDFYGNGVGTDTAGARDLGNTGVGVLIAQDSDNNTFGGNAARAFNQVRFNGSHGVQVNDTQTAISEGNTLWATEFDANGGLAIELNNDGVTANDAGDGDNGPNALQNHPLLTAVAANGDVSGTLNSRANRQYRIDVYQSFACDPSGAGEGGQFYGSAIVQTTGFNAAFSVSPQIAPPFLPALTAIATDLTTGDTSEFSACLTNPDALTFIVNSTGDGVTAPPDGACDVNPGTPGAQCTLREALGEINAAGLAFPMTIRFDLPPGSVIRPATDLPQINAPVLIDGFSAGAANGCSATTAGTPTIGVTLDGGPGSGLLLHNGSNGSTVRGLAITNFGAQGIFVGGSGTLTALSADTQIYCNLIGVTPDGLAGGNATDGIRLGGRNHTVAHNIIGFNGGDGIEIGNSQPGVIIGNAIGTDLAGAADFGNSGNGIHLATGSFRYAIGDLNGARPNVIHHNGGAGIYVAAGGLHTLAINRMRNNGGLGIDLAPAGHTPNDAGDGDSGANDLQNFPLIGGQSSCNIDGTLNSRANRPYRVDVYHTTSCSGSPLLGEGESWFGAITVTTDAGGNATFSVPSANDTTGYPFFVATATDLTNGNTSEFSSCYPYNTGVPTQIALSDLLAPPADGPAGRLLPVALLSVLLLALSAWALRRRHAGLLLLLALGVVLALAQTPPPPAAAAPNSCTVISGVLADSGFVTDAASGLSVGTVAGTLAAPVGVALGSVPTPGEPYDDAATVVSPYYQITPQAALNVAPATPLIVGIPVPPGAAPTDLMVAVYSDLGRSTHGGDGFGWAHFQLYYDAAANMLTWTRDALPAAGLTFVLVEHSTFDTLPDPTPRAAAPESVSFQITCMFVSCTSGRRNAYQTALLNAYNDYTARGLRPPRLKNVIATAPSQIPGETQLYTAQVFYGVKVRPTSPRCVSSSGVTYAGIYHPAEQELEICDAAVPVTAFTHETIRHELFHAVQFAYPAVNQFPDWDQSWVIEGTAAAAERSSTTMARSDAFNWRKIGTRLDAKAVAGQTYEYDAQDFWVYHGQANGLGLGYLHTIFEHGIELADLDRRLPNGYTLASGYWEWIKNQAFERVIGFNGALVGSCLPSDGVLAAEPDLATPLTTLTHAVGSGCTQTPLIQQSRMTSTLFAVAFSGSAQPFDVEITIVPTLADPLLVHKVYDPAEAACWSVPVGPRTFEDVTVGEQRYVLVANALPDLAKSYRVQVCDVVTEGS